jgi:hypothetical protein
MMEWVAAISMMEWMTTITMMERGTAITHAVTRITPITHTVTRITSITHSASKELSFHFISPPQIVSKVVYVSMFKEGIDICLFVIVFLAVILFVI